MPRANDCVAVGRCRAACKMGCIKLDRGVYNSIRQTLWTAHSIRKVNIPVLPALSVPCFASHAFTSHAGNLISQHFQPILLFSQEINFE